MDVAKGLSVASYSNDPTKLQEFAIDAVAKFGYSLDSTITLINISENATFKVTDKKTTNSLDGYATPYWDGNCYLPIDIEYYNFTDDDGNPDDEELTGDYYERYKLPTEFESFQTIIDWMENDYIKYIIDFCRKTFEELES